MSNKVNYTMKDLPVQERPYERCLRYGAECLSDAELLAVVLRSGSEGDSAIDLAYSVLRSLDQKKGLSDLHQISVAELCKIRGIGKVKAIQLKCVAELSKRITMTGSGEEQVFQNADMVAELCMEQMRYLDHEEVFLLSFDMKGHLLSQKKISVGTVNQSLLSPREIFLEAMKSQAAYVILVHNHPSGDPTPSRADDELTKRVTEAGRLLGIELADHIVIGNRKYYSYREMNCGT